MFHIKICGITTVEDAITAVDAGADAVGLNFYSHSKRCVNPRVARDIIETVQDRCIKVAVIVDHAVDDLNTLVRKMGIDAAQLHGDQAPDYLARIDRGIPAIKVHRIDSSSLKQVERTMHECSMLGRRPDAVLVDAFMSGEFGGTGKTLEWNALAREVDRMRDRDSALVPFILAGGLTPDNVYEAILTVRPDGVDTASGVESSPAKKDPQKVRDFIAEAKRGFAEIGLL